MIRKVIAASFPMILSINAMATCENGSETVFSCLTGKGKLIQVCDSKKTIDYSFGKPGKTPEIVVRAPRNSVTTTQGSGSFSTQYYSVHIPNGNTVYSVFWGVVMATDNPSVDAGVEVEINEKHAATVECVDEDNIVQNMEGIDLKPAE